MSSPRADVGDVKLVSSASAFKKKSEEGTSVAAAASEVNHNNKPEEEEKNTCTANNSNNADKSKTANSIIEALRESEMDDFENSTAAALSEARWDEMFERLMKFKVCYAAFCKTKD